MRGRELISPLVYDIHDIQDFFGVHTNILCGKAYFLRRFLKHLHHIRSRIVPRIQRGPNGLGPRGYLGHFRIFTERQVSADIFDGRRWIENVAENSVDESRRLKISIGP